MPESKSDTIGRLRREAAAAERQGWRMLEASALITHGALHEKVRLDGMSLLAEAEAMREHAAKLESDPLDSI
jgi:hypothetical protein